MSKKILWMVVSGLMVLSLVMAACGPAAVEEKGKAPIVEETKPAPVVEEKKQEVAVEKKVAAAETPRYGGTLNLVLSSDDTNFDDIVTRSTAPGAIFQILNEAMWQGDWAKGAAGGYGTSESDWMDKYDVWHLNTGSIAESWKWTFDEAKNQGILIYQIRRGVHWALNPKSEASRLVGGREVTADDVVFSLKQMITDPRAYLYQANPALRAAQITKTGPGEVTIKVPLVELITAISRFGNYGRVVPPEVVAKFGDMAKWQNSVGTGPFMITEYVAGSNAVLVKNPNYWRQDPVGPGKGNQLPYLDVVRFVIIPDLSTRQAALRTGKIDVLAPLSWEDAARMRKTTPALLEIAAPVGSGGGAAAYVYMRTDKPPFNDVRVRRAMHMAIDFEAIRQNLHNGLGQVLTWPFEYSKPYADLYLGPDAPDMPASVKELYSYNPEKARQLLKEAGYPNGFKTSALIVASEVDYYSIIKDMWAKVGIDLKLDVREVGVKNAIVRTRTHEALTTTGRGPIGIWYLGIAFTGEGNANASMVNDSFVNKGMEEIRTVALRDMREAMKQMKELLKYLLDQAYVITAPNYGQANFWWPWVKNYSGETSLGYFVNTWTAYIWLDQELKKSMGY